MEVGTHDMAGAGVNEDGDWSGGERKQRTETETKSEGCFTVKSG